MSRLAVLTSFLLAPPGLVLAGCGASAAPQDSVETRSADAGVDPSAHFVRKPATNACPTDGGTGQAGCVCQTSGSPPPAVCDPCHCPSGYSASTVYELGLAIPECVQDDPCPWLCSGTTTACSPVGGGCNQGVACERTCATQTCENQCTAGVPPQLGAWVLPDNVTDGGAQPPDIDALQADLQAQCGSQLLYSLHYLPDFGTAPELVASWLGGNNPLQDDIAHLRIPILSLECDRGVYVSPHATLGTTIAALASEFNAYYKAAKAVSGAPRDLIVRYCWEMNAGSPAKGGSPATLIPAWQYLHDQLMCDQYATNHGVSNVYWFFCPTDGASGINWYPGDAYVDYIGFDTYDKTGAGLYATINAPYSTYIAIDKPVIVGETAELMGSQSQYLNAAAATTFANNWPKIVGVDYFDAPNKCLTATCPQYATCSTSDPACCTSTCASGQTAYEWSFTTNGITAFEAFALALPAAYP